MADIIQIPWGVIHPVTGKLSVPREPDGNPMTTKRYYNNFSEEELQEIKKWKERLKKMARKRTGLARNPFSNTYSKQDAVLILREIREFFAVEGKRLIGEIDDNDYRGEWYFVPSTMTDAAMNKFNKIGFILERAGMMAIYPTTEGFMCVLDEDRAVSTVTATKTHIRLPKLSHLINLTPDDFFAIMRLIATSEASAVDSLKLDVVAANVYDLDSFVITEFFELLRTNYRTRPEHADKKWTNKKCVEQIAFLEPDIENQLYALQYITSVQNKDLPYFPINTAVELEIPFDQVNDEYAINEYWRDNEGQRKPKDWGLY